MVPAAMASGMSDRSNEVTASREPTSTDDLLEETEELLSGGSLEGDDGRGRPEADARGGHESIADGLEEGSLFDSSPEPDAPASEESTRSGGRSLRSKLSPTRYFSSKAFLGLVFVFGAALLIGGSLVPFFGGRLLGVFAAAFLVGLVTAKRRYLEVGTAGTAVGAVAAFFDYAVFTLVGGGGTLIAIGTTAGAVACLLGYYFGRDLRDGLSREI